MKKTFALLLVAILCLSMAACQNAQDSNYGKYDRLIRLIEENNRDLAMLELNTLLANNAQEEDETDPLIIYNSLGGAIVNEDRIHECIDEVVELTTENWREYINVIKYSKNYVRKDAFGEITETGTRDIMELGMETDRYYAYEDVVIELRHIETGTVETVSRFGGAGLLPIYSSINLDDYECIRIKGKVYFLTFPEEAIKWEETTNFVGIVSTVGTVNVGSKNGFFTWYTIDQVTNYCDTSNRPLSEYLNQ